MLADTLSAMRQLILDDVAIPPSQSERLITFRRLFPSLSLVEIEDLAKVPPEGFHTYTRSIFAGEKNVLRNHFPLTFELIRVRATDALREEVDMYDLVKDLHRSYPWKGNSTRALLMNFALYLENQRDDLRQAVPELVDAAAYEFLRSEVSAAVDSPVEALPLISEEQLRQTTVLDLLGYEFAVPTSVRFQHFPYDVLSLREQFVRNDRTLPEEPATCTETRSVVSRSREQWVWGTNLPVDVYELLSEAERDSFMPLEQLAVALVDGSPGDDEEALFRQFFELLTALYSRGAIAIRQPR